MSDNSSAIKTIAALVLLLIVLAVLYIVGYNPIALNTSSPENNQPTISPADCTSEDSDEVTRCCQAWAVDNNLVTTDCIGNWTWTKLGGCSFTCSSEPDTQ